MSERFDAEGNLSEEGKFDKEGNELKFDESGKIVEDLSADALHKVADETKKGSDGILNNEDDDQIFLENDDLDDLFDEVPIEETDDEKLARETEEEERRKKLEEGNDLNEPPEPKEPEGVEKENAALRARVKELELGHGLEQKPIDLPEDDAPMTVGKFKELQDALAHNEALERRNFTQDYVLSFYKEGYKEGMVDKDIDALFAFLQLPENNAVDAIHYTADKMDGVTSGVINFNKIMRVFSKKEALPLGHKGVKPEDLLHGKGKLGKTKRVVKVEKLDEFSQRFIKSTNMSEDDIADALATPSNIQSRGGRKL